MPQLREWYRRTHRYTYCIESAGESSDSRSFYHGRCNCRAPSSWSPRMTANNPLCKRNVFNSKHLRHKLWHCWKQVSIGDSISRNRQHFLAASPFSNCMSFPPIHWALISFESAHFRYTLWKCVLYTFLSTRLRNSQISWYLELVTWNAGSGWECAPGHDREMSITHGVINNELCS